MVQVNWFSMLVSVIIAIRCQFYYSLSPQALNLSSSCVFSIAFTEVVSSTPIVGNSYLRLSWDLVTGTLLELTSNNLLVYE